MVSIDPSLVVEASEIRRFGGLAARICKMDESNGELHLSWSHTSKHSSMIQSSLILATTYAVPKVVHTTIFQLVKLGDHGV